VKQAMIEHMQRGKIDEFFTPAAAVDPLLPYVRLWGGALSNSLVFGKMGGAA
jgi:hypothetical protein